MKYLLRFFGYEFKQPSLLYQNMIDFTHRSWLEDLYNQNRINDYVIKH